MVQEQKSEGICSTCRYRSACLSYNNSRNAATPVLHCEEYDSGFVNREKSITFENLPNFRVKNLIPGWGSRPV